MVRRKGYAGGPVLTSHDVKLPVRSLKDNDFGGADVLDAAARARQLLEIRKQRAALLSELARHQEARDSKQAWIFGKLHNTVGGLAVDGHLACNPQKPIHENHGGTHSLA